MHVANSKYASYGFCSAAIPLEEILLLEFLFKTHITWERKNNGVKPSVMDKGNKWRETQHNSQWVQPYNLVVKKKWVLKNIQTDFNYIGSLVFTLNQL